MTVVSVYTYTYTVLGTIETLVCFLEERHSLRGKRQGTVHLHLHLKAPARMPRPEERETLEIQVIELFKSKEIVVDKEHIAACYTFPFKYRKTNPVIIMRFANRIHKDLQLKQGRKLEGSDVYLNEHLTKKNADIAREARVLKKQKEIQGTWTRNCKIMIKLNGPAETVLVVRDKKELEKYKWKCAEMNINTTVSARFISAICLLSLKTAASVQNSPQGHMLL